MGKINIIPTTIKDLLIIEPTVFGDSRGYFLETYNQRDYREAGLDAAFVQDNLSLSRKGVLRGLHFQKQFPQGKLVSVIKGEVFDVTVDLRKGSETFGKWAGYILSEANKRQFYIPAGFAHGFLVLSDEAVFSYKCTKYYDPKDEYGIIWNDPDVGVEWPLQNIDEILLSEKDKKWGKLKDTVLE